MSERMQVNEWAKRGHKYVRAQGAALILASVFLATGICVLPIRYPEITELSWLVTSVVYLGVIAAFWGSHKRSAREQFWYYLTQAERELGRPDASLDDCCNRLDAAGRIARYDLRRKLRDRELASDLAQRVSGLAVKLDSSGRSELEAVHECVRNALVKGESADGVGVRDSFPMAYQSLRSRKLTVVHSLVWVVILVGCAVVFFVSGVVGVGVLAALGVALTAVVFKGRDPADFLSNRIVDLFGRSS